MLKGGRPDTATATFTGAVIEWNSIRKRNLIVRGNKKGVAGDDGLRFNNLFIMEQNL